MDRSRKEKIGNLLALKVVTASLPKRCKTLKKKGKTILVSGRGGP
jgi:hypothetical protein